MKTHNRMNPNTPLLYSFMLLLCTLTAQAQEVQQKKPYLQMGHQKAISVLEMSHQGFCFATGSTDNEIRIWDTDKKVERFVLKGHEGDIEGLAFSKNDQYLASSAADGKVMLWSVQEGNLLYVFEGHTSNVKAVVFHPNDSLLISAGSDKKINVWNIFTGKLQKTFAAHPKSIYTLAFDKNGHKLLSAGLDRQIRQWDFKTGKLDKVLAECQYPIFDIEISPNDTLLLSAGGSKFEDKGELKLWDRHSALLKADLQGHQAEIYQARFSPEGTYLLSAGGSDLRSELKYWSVKEAQLLRNLEGHSSRVRAITFNTDGSKIISAGGENNGNLSELKIWDTESGSLLQNLQSKGSPVTALALTQDSEWLASGYANGEIRLWNLQDAQKNYLLKKHQKAITDLCFHPSQSLLASTGEDGASIVWDFQNTDSLQTAQIRKIWQDNFPKQCIAFSPNGKTLAMAGIADIYLAELASLNMTDTLKNAHDLYIYGLRFAADNQTLWSIGYDKTIKIWELSSKKRIKHISQDAPLIDLDQNTALDKYLTVSYDNKIKMWSSAGQFLSNIGNAEIQAKKAIFLKNTSQFAAIGARSEISIVSLQQRTKTLKGHLSGVNALVASHNGKYLVSGGKDGMVIFWQIDTATAALYLLHFDETAGAYLILNAEGKYTTSSEMRDAVYWGNDKTLGALSPELRESNVLQRVLEK